jgi:REP element-mobilizing transposase RayT
MGARSLSCSVRKGGWPAVHSQVQEVLVRGSHLCRAPQLLAHFVKRGNHLRCSSVTDIWFRVSYSVTMPRGLHRTYGGRDLHFLTFSCYRRKPLFDDATLCDLFLSALERVRRRYRLVVLGYVVMPEHVHLLVSEPQRSTLSTVIQALKLSFVRRLEMNRGGRVPRSGSFPCLAKSARHGAPPR